MFKNYLRVGYRNLIRSKTFSFINILGLAVGIAAAMLVVIYVIDEVSYDQFHSKKDRIYRLSFEEQRQDNTFRFAKVPFPVRNVLMESIPEIEEITRIYSNTKVSGAAMIHVEEEIYAEPNLWFAEPSFFNVFDFEFVSGSRESALTIENTAILTESTAKKYFGTVDPIGKTIKYDKGTSLEVIGVMKDPPTQSHIQFSILVPKELLRNIWVRDFNYDLEKDWNWSGSHSYMMLKESSSIKAVEDKLPKVVADHFQHVNETFKLVAFPMEDIYLQSTYKGEILPSESQARQTQLYIFSAIAAIILLVAAINFMNLSTARSIKRAREVGIRKVMGAQRRFLIFQFLGEALMISLLALIHAMLLVNLTLPMFNRFTGKTFQFADSVLNIEVGLMSLVITVFIGLFSGTYPALFLSSFKPIKTLKNDFRISGNLGLRKLFVIIQFTITIMFISAVVVVFEQLEYIKNKDLGFDMDQTLVVNNRTLMSQEYAVLKSELMKSPDVSDVYLGHIPGKPAWGNTVIPEGYTEEDALSISLMYVGYGVTDFFDIDILNGRPFTKTLDVDTVNAQSSFMINKRLADFIGWEIDEAIGKEIKWIGGNNNQQLIKGRVVAVVDDFHFSSLYNEIRPLLFRLSNWGEVAIKYKMDRTNQLLPFVEQTWNEAVPSQKFEYSFLDEDLMAQYEKEENLSSLITYFSVLAVLISCLGLFGLSSFSMEQRKKEFAIRKTLGATIKEISTLISSDFGKLILIASLIACPIAWLIMQSWLNDFTYGIDLKLWHFGFAAFVGLFVALSTVSVQLLKAASANPVDSLRNE